MFKNSTGVDSKETGSFIKHAISVNVFATEKCDIFIYRKKIVKKVSSL